MLVAFLIFNSNIGKLYNNSYFEAGRRPRKRSLLKRK